MRALLKKLKAEQSALDKKEGQMYSKAFQPWLKLHIASNQRLRRYEAVHSLLAAFSSTQ